MKLFFLKCIILVISMILSSSCASKNTASEYKNEVRKTISENLNSIQKCYADLIKIYPGLQGRVMTDFIINPNGEVIQAKIESSTAKNTQLEECVVKQIKTIKFSKNKEGTDVGVKYPFVFQPTPP